jgi:hypothetical protein
LIRLLALDENMFSLVVRVTERNDRGGRFDVSTFDDDKQKGVKGLLGILRPKNNFLRK